MGTLESQDKMFDESDKFAEKTERKKEARGKKGLKDISPLPWILFMVVVLGFATFSEFRNSEYYKYVLIGAFVLSVYVFTPKREIGLLLNDSGYKMKLFKEMRYQQKMGMKPHGVLTMGSSRMRKSGGFIGTYYTGAEIKEKITDEVHYYVGEIEPYTYEVTDVTELDKPFDPYDPNCPILDTQLVASPELKEAKRSDSFLKRGKMF